MYQDQKYVGENYPHLLVRNTVATGAYTYPKKTNGGPRLNVPRRVREQHSHHLLEELREVSVVREEVGEARRAVGLNTDRGICLEFESEPGFDLAFQSLDRRDRKHGDIELLAVRETGDRIVATVLVPEGTLQRLVDLVDAYASQEDRRTGKPKNRKLVETISHIRHAALEAFWTDQKGLLPAPGNTLWWEVWLRAGKDGDAIREDFQAQAQRLGLRIGNQWLVFPDRTVGLAFGTRDQMAASVRLLDCIAELRRAKETAGFFTSKDARMDQPEWIESYRRLVTLPPDDAPAVCVLDTGISRGHPLLRDVLDPADVLSCHPDWGTHDGHGHGTEMAGLAAHGDLTEALQRTSPVVLEHRLESVKLKAPELSAPDAELPDAHVRMLLYGALTRDATSRIETVQPFRDRAYCMAIATSDGRDRGAPSSWSAEVDSLCFGEDQRRLFVLAAGNVRPRERWADYPDVNDTEGIHDPGQAWNALTVGAYTDKWRLETEEDATWRPIARPGTLSPSSTTSLKWGSPWPNKPDVVEEGGNAARNDQGIVDALDDLSLLTTSRPSGSKLLATSGDTSAASAQVARIGAILMARYPAYWPETIRGLIVHSAQWKPAMENEAPKAPSNRYDYLLRRYGYGVPDLQSASWSASNLLTLVAQEVVTPYGKEKHRVGTQDWNLHDLPWPREQLAEQLRDTIVDLRVTLSYFVEPNPGRRGWKYRHRYQSHGLRFALQNAEESLADFKARISRDAQDEELGKPEFREPGWRLGQKRNRGSIHSDMWSGLAADLAARHHVAVFPVGGWWKERHHLERWKQSVRYSLIVSIRTPETGVDIYTPIATRIGIPVSVETDT